MRRGYHPDADPHTLLGRYVDLLESQFDEIRTGRESQEEVIPPKAWGYSPVVLTPKTYREISTDPIELVHRMGAFLVGILHHDSKIGKPVYEGSESSHIPARDSYWLLLWRTRPTLEQFRDFYTQQELFHTYTRLAWHSFPRRDIL